jgi:2-polyprenyl-6-methoxyphenol hydroxylase-like FAD-dependent oxidoreductase
LLASGVVEASIVTQMPASLTNRAAWPDDARLTMLMTRRSTVDWVLRRAVRIEPGVTFRPGIRVTGLTAVPGRPPRVTGVRTDQGDVAADLVVNAAGSHLRIDDWLTAISASASATRWAECGLAYFSRHYRVRRAADAPGPPTTRIVIGFDEFTAGIWSGDNGTMVLSIAPLVEDRRFRPIRNPEVFNAVLRTVPTFAAWLDVLDPISPIFPLGGLHNTMRHLVVDGAPVVVGLLCIGDAVSTTNPTHGRGLGLALTGASDLVNTIATHGDDWTAQAAAMEALVVDHIEPFFEDQARNDAARLSMLRHTIFGAPTPEPMGSITDRVTFPQLRAAAQFDPMAFRAFWSVFGMTRRPDEVYADPEVVTRVREVLGERGVVPAMPQPSREQLLAALSVGT